MHNYAAPDWLFCDVKEFYGACAGAVQCGVSEELSEILNCIVYFFNV